MTSRTTILLSGLPGRMAAEVAETALEAPWPASLALLEVALTGSGVSDESCDIQGQPVRLVSPADRASLEIPPGTIAVDFTEPDAALDNVAYFCARGIPFIMGTTGFDRAKAEALVAASSISAVIAPNMAIPIVLIQSALGTIAERFAGSMRGYQFGVMESHQRSKKDTSGTAKALVASFSKLGLPATTESIKMIRDPDVQTRELGVPADHVAGHAYHFYEVASPGGDVRIELSHCVNGRRVYAEGALYAVEFLKRRLAEGSRGEVYSMIDVLGDMQQGA